jgi:hypothetical protein
VEYAQLVTSLEEFHQDTESCLGVKEDDLGSPGSHAAFFFDEGDSLGLQLGKGRLEIVNPEGDVLIPATALVVLDKLGDGAVGCYGFEKFHFHVAHREERRRDFLLRHRLTALVREAQDLRVEFLGLLDTGPLFRCDPLSVLS